jgi:hypothetical protein
VDAQNAKIWTVSALIGIEPTVAQIGGNVRATVQPVGNAL